MYINRSGENNFITDLIHMIGSMRLIYKDRRLTQQI